MDASEQNKQALVQSAYIDNWREIYNIGYENQTGLVVDLNNFLIVDRKALEDLCKQVLEAKCPEGAEYAVGIFHSCPFCEATSINAYNSDIDLIEHDKDCAYNIAKELLNEN